MVMNNFFSSRVEIIKHVFKFPHLKMGGRSPIIVEVIFEIVNNIVLPTKIWVGYVSFIF